MVKSEQKIRSSPEPTKFLKTTSSSESSSSAGSSNKKMKFKGVRMRSWGSWVSEIRAPNQKARIWLGSYSTAEAAARAYDAALICIKGPVAANPSLNFPLSSYSQFQQSSGHDSTTMMSPKTIQRVAAAAAAASPPPSPQPELSPPSAASSPSISYSSPSEDDVANPLSDFVNESMADIESWCNLESPKYMDLMMANGAAFHCVPAAADDFLYDDGDIRLWNFC